MAEEEGFLLDEETARRLIRMLRAWEREPENGRIRPTLSRGGVPAQEVQLARVTSGTADGNGHYPAVLLQPDLDDMDGVDAAEILLRPLNGATLTNDTVYPCRPWLLVDGERVYIVTEAVPSAGSGLIGVTDLTFSTSTVFITSSGKLLVDRAEGLAASNITSPITGTKLTLREASTTQAGTVTTTTQTFAADKTFEGTSFKVIIGSNGNPTVYAYSTAPSPVGFAFWESYVDGVTGPCSTSWIGLIRDQASGISAIQGKMLTAGLAHGGEFRLEFDEDDGGDVTVQFLLGCANNADKVRYGCYDRANSVMRYGQVAASLGNLRIQGGVICTGSSAVQNGDLLYGNNADGGYSRLPIGTDGKVLTVVSGQPAWATATGGSGTVTSVALSLPTSIFDVSGSPVTGSGTITVTLDNQTANTVWAGPTTGAAATPTFRALVPADIPSLPASQITSGILGLANGGTGADLSATGPGFLRQATAGATITVSTVDLSSSDCTGTLAAGRFPALTGDVTTSAGNLTTTIAADAVTNSKLANMAAGTIKARQSSTGDPQDLTLSEVLDLVGSAAQGDILYRGAATWTRLGAGTSGHYLKTQGAGANPTWATVAGLDITGLTATDPALDDEAPIYDTSATANRKATIQRVLGLSRRAPGGRLYLSSGNPFGTGSGTTVYYGPAYHDLIELWDGTRWLPIQFTETSVSFSGASTSVPYDIFGYLSSGALAIEKLVWTSASARATAVTLQDGRYCKSGDKTRLLLGTATADGINLTVAADSTGMDVWNAYNRIPYAFFKPDTTNSWTDSGNGTWSQINGGNAAWVYPVTTGLTAAANAEANLVVAGGYYFAVGNTNNAIDRNRTTVGGTTGGSLVQGTARYVDSVLGYRVLYGVETTYAAVTGTAYGDNGATVGSGNVPCNSGMFVWGEW